MKLLTCLILLISLLSVCYSQCIPGDFLNPNNPEQGCIACTSGHYCPSGNGQPILCPDGTIAPNRGYSTCTPCQYKRSDSTRTVCLLPNTPQDARNIEQDEIVDLRKGTNFYTTVKLYETIPQYVEISVIGSDAIVLCVSDSTGQPTIENTEIKNFGMNATVIVDRALLTKKEGFVLYLSIKPLTSNNSPLVTIKFNKVFAIYNILPNIENIITPQNGLVSDEGGIISFIVDNVPIGSHLNVTVHAQFAGVYVKFALCHSSIPSMIYPNIENSDQVVYSKRSDAKASIANMNIKVFTKSVAFSFVKPFPLSYPTFKIMAQIKK